MPAQAIVRLMNREDRQVAKAVAREIPAIARAVDAIVQSLQQGGRLFYVGAGSSGRMGVLDAAECAPTFGTSRSVVQALIAGGRRAVTNAVEGAEDATRNGERDLRVRKLTRKDVVVGIAASGTTPYVLGALKYARKCKATTVALTADRNMPVAKLAQILIAPEVGPEVLTGSTRLKAGSAQKMVLNMLSTAAMVRESVRGQTRSAAIRTRYASRAGHAEEENRPRASAAITEIRRRQFAPRLRRAKAAELGWLIANSWTNSSSPVAILFMAP